MFQHFIRVLASDVKLSRRTAMISGSLLAALAIAVLVFLWLTRRGDPEFATVEGTVTLDGKPLPGVFIGYYPIVYPRAGPRSHGMTDENGHYRLRADDFTERVVVGRQQVVIVPQGDRSSEEAQAKFAEQVPEVYYDLLHTPFEFSVHKGAQTIDLHLKRNAEGSSK